MLVTGTDDIDVSGQGKRLASWSISQGAGANTVNFRRGTVSGAVVFQVQVPTITSASQAYPSPPYCKEGWFVEVVGTGLNFVCVDVI